MDWRSTKQYPNPIRAEGAYLTAIRSPLTTIQSSLATRLGGDNTNRTEDQYLTALITSLNSANGSLNTRLVELTTTGYAGSVSYTDPAVKHVPGTEPKWLDQVSVSDPFSGMGKRLGEYEGWLGRPVSWVVDNCFEGRTLASVHPVTEPRRVLRRPQLLRGWSHDEASPTLSPEVRERAVRMVLEHQGDHDSQYGAIRSIAAKIGCSGETLRNWVR